MTDSILSLREFGVAFGEKTILNGVNIDIPERGIVVLIGPSGTGKSTLLRTLSGHNDANPSLNTWGNVSFAGTDINNGERPSLVAQKTTLLMASIRENIVYDMPERNTLNITQQKDVASRLLKKAGLDEFSNHLDDNVMDFPLGVQRHIAIARTIASNPKLVFIDEPTTGLDEEDTHRLLSYIIKESERRAVVVVVHNQKQAIILGGITALLAGGWIHEIQPTDDFFKNPQTQAAKDFVRSGSCCVPAPDTPVEHLNDDCKTIAENQKSSYHNAPQKIPEQASKYKSDSFGPRNFLWLRKGELAGTPKPGLFTELDYDLAALQRVGISVLISLTQKPIEQSSLIKYGIQGISFPIKDMGVPSIVDAIQQCKRVEDLLEQGEAIAMHCKAGMGRTGTMLAAQLIWEGDSASDALEKARKIEPRWVQSEEQVSFLEEFSCAVAEKNNTQTERIRSAN